MSKKKFSINGVVFEDHCVICDPIMQWEDILTHINKNQYIDDGDYVHLAIVPNSIDEWWSDIDNWNIIRFIHESYCDSKNEEQLVPDRLLPDWYVDDPGKYKEMFKTCVKDWMENLIHRNETIDVVTDGIWFLDNCNVDTITSSDSANTYVYIHNSNIDTIDGYNTIINTVCGESKINTVTGNTIINYVFGSTLIHNMKKYSKIINIDDNSSVIKMSECSTIINLTNSNVNIMSDTSYIKNVDDSSVYGMIDNSYIEYLYDNAKVYEMCDRSSIGTIQATSTVYNMFGHATVKNMCYCSIIFLMQDYSVVGNIVIVTKSLSEVLTRPIIQNMRDYTCIGENKEHCNICNDLRNIYYV